TACRRPTKRSCRCDTKNKIPAVVRNRKGVLTTPAALVCRRVGWQMPKRRARNHPAADVLAGVDQNRVFARFPLTDGQWQNVAKMSGIPEGADDARHDIETRIGGFANSKPAI